MTLEYMIYKASSQFLSNHTEKTAMRVLAHYAMQELGVPDGDFRLAPENMQAFLEELLRNNSPDQMRFYTWYYLTYVIENSAGKEYRIQMYRVSADEYVGIEIEPMRMGLFSGNPLPEKCDRGKAQFWSVLLLRSKNALPILVADCEDEESARLIERLIRATNPNLGWE